MIYTIIRLGFDGIYSVSKLSYDGICYLIYGHQETTDEKIEKEMTRIQLKLDKEDSELREIKQMLSIIMKKDNLFEKIESGIEDIVMVTDHDESNVSLFHK